MACRTLVSSSSVSSFALSKAPRTTICCSRRLLSTTLSQLADVPAQSSPSSTAPSPSLVRPSPSSSSSSSSTNAVLDALTNIGSNLSSGKANGPSVYGLTSSSSSTTSVLDKYISPSGATRQGEDEYHLHVYSTKHNTHLTLSDQDRKSIISISCGNLGFRKSQRGTYDAGYQLMAYLLSRMQQQALIGKIHKLELCLRGFGQGREAVTKLLLGAEGTRLRESIVRVVDKTRLKIGGNRSPAPRRLG